MIFKATLIRRQKLAESCISFDFAIAEGQQLEFAPGQYLMAEVGDIRRRPYTIARSSPQRDQFTLLIDTSPQGIGSKFFEALEAGEGVEMQGPFGLMALEEATSYLFIAAGVGIAPFMPMLEKLFSQEKEFKGPVRFVQGARFAQDLLFPEEFNSHQTNHTNFQWIKALSQDPAENAFHGRVDAWIQQHFELNENELIYLCGAPEMVRDCRASLQLKGVNQKNIRIEVFS